MYNWLTYMNIRQVTSPSDCADPVDDVSRGRVWQRFFATARSERGQALIEFAFVLPVLLVFMLTLLDFGLALDRREVIQHAVREGTRQAAIGLNEPGVIDVVEAQSQGVLEEDRDKITVCVVPGPGGELPGLAGSDVSVSATFKYHFTLGSGELLSAIGIPPPIITMTPSAEARLETSIAGLTEC